ncbi:MAG: cytochrome c maturation protein CcmE [Fimbriimonas sp.]|jgi:cytochrome c-type biogenesis protein CcmE
MKKTVILPVIIAIVALGAAMAVFSSGASPYVTLAEARKISSDRINLGVEIDKTTIKTELRSNVIEFDGKDKNGEKVHVKYIGDPVDLSQAERVTCIGKLEGELFVTDQMLIKCPSKYEEEKKAAVNEGKASK